MRTLTDKKKRNTTNKRVIRECLIIWESCTQGLLNLGWGNVSHFSCENLRGDLQVSSNTASMFLRQVKLPKNCHVAAENR